MEKVLEATSLPKSREMTWILTQNLLKVFLKSLTVVKTEGLQLDGTLSDLSLEILLIPKQWQNKRLQDASGKEKERKKILKRNKTSTVLIFLVFLFSLK